MEQKLQELKTKKCNSFYEKLQVEKEIEYLERWLKNLKHDR